MPRYSDELKDSILVRILNDENINIQELSRETGIHENTLRKWRSSAKRSGISPSSNNKSSEKWSTQ
ncbi:MAG: transposase, partial [Proteocatella sp.]